MFSLFEAARWPPSGGNQKPWAFIVVLQENREAFARLAELLNERNRMWASRAPLLVLAIMRREYAPGRDNPFAAYDLGQAVAHLSIQAESMGLRVHQMGGFDAAKARESFNIPEGNDPLTVFAIGYHGNVDALPAPLREREHEERTRKPLNEFVFEQRWGEPIGSSES